MSAQDTSSLQTLFKTITNSVQGGQLVLLPSWFPGNAPVNAALNALGAAAGLTITNVNPQFPAGATQITITGTVTLGSTSFAAEVDIGLDDAQNYTITIVLPPKGQTSPLSMTLPGAPWFQLASPSISVTTVAGSTSLLSGIFGGTITIAGFACNASAALQSDGSWIFTMDWVSPGPSIDGVFQFIGGINLSASLPSPLNAISTLQLQTLGFQYNFSTKTLEMFTIALDGLMSPGWDVFNNTQLVLSDFAFTFINDRTKNAVTWTAASSFQINQHGPLDVTLSYADRTFTLHGAPATGATAVTLVDFVDMFFPSSVQLLPQSVSPGTVQSFDATFARATGKTPANYKVSVELGANASWVFNNTLSVESLGFTVDATKSPTVGSITGTIEFFKSQPKPLQVDVAAVYDGSEWVLSTTQVADTSTDVASIIGGLGIPVPSPLNFSVTGFSSTIHTGTTSPSPYVVVSGSVQDFTMPFDLPVQLDKVSGCFGVSIGSSSSGATVTPACLDADATLPFASINADTTWWGVPITFGYEYSTSSSYTVTWAESNGTSIVGTISKPDADWIATIAFTGSTTVGGLVESFVSWATGYAYGLASPWNLLDDISLSGLELQFDFTAKTVGLTVNFGIDLGFCSISGATLTYNAGDTLPAGTDRVSFALNGNFPWNAGSSDADNSTNKLSWDATKPESTKTPPGKGNGYLDLRLLAIGQHVTIPGVASAATVQDAMTAFTTNAPAPPSGSTPVLPSVVYDSTTSWLIGLDMGLLQLSDDDPDAPGYCVTVQIVFDDPNLYGLRIALQGTPAKVFGGLDFEIMYRKISDTLGVYEAELTLPTAMRTIQTGIYTIQLPTFGVSVYTNGDFEIDVGFPWNADFSRSFTVQAIIAPGIPVLGSGGFYFGKLSSATSSSVPVVTNGTFDPVIVFGFGAQVGFGKSVSIGPLSASFSLTVLAIIQGVIARWNGFTSADQPGGQASTQIDGVYYYSLTGTFGIAGSLNGSIDFVIIKASVNISITVTAQITFAAYEPIVLTISASVDVSASLEINCGLFSFSISFHFSLDLNETFTIPSPSSGSPPWQVATSSSSAQFARPATRVTRMRRSARMLLGDAPAWSATPTWTNLTAAQAALPLQGYLTFALTAAADENVSSNPNQVCYVATLAIDAQNPITIPAGAPCAAAGDTSWDALAKLATRWVLAAFWTAPVSCDATTGVDSLVITEAELLTIHEYLAQEDANGNPLPNPIPMPIDPTALETMLEQQISMTLTGPSDGTAGVVKNVKTSFFPMPGAIGMTIPAYGSFPGYAYSFGGFNTIATADLPLLQSYFNQIAVQVKNEQDAGPSLYATEAAAVTSLSVAGFVFTDYFLLVARQMIANLQAGLRDFKYSYVPAGGALPSVQGIVNFITNAGGLTPGVPAPVSNPSLPPNAAPDVPYTAADVFANNTGMALAASQTMTIAGAQATAQATDTFTTIAQNALYGKAFTAAALALQNVDNALLFQANQPMTYNGASLLTDSADTLTSLAARFTVLLGTTVQASDLANSAAIQTQQNLLIPLAKVALPAFPYTTQSTDTVGSVAAAFGVTAASLGAPLSNGNPNPNVAIAGLFAPSSGNAYVDIPHLTQLSVGALIAEAQATGTLDTLSAMVSRFHLHGLRLPTVTGSPATPLITPNTQGMWVTGSGSTLALPPAAGLFALTGQQFPIPAITSTAFTATLAGGPSWIKYLSATSGVLSITNATNDPYDPAIEALRSVVTAAGYRFVSGYTVPTTDSQIARTPATYSMGTYQNWLSAAIPALPAPAPAAGAVARIWPFSTGLSSILNSATHAVNPDFILQTQTYDQATGKTIAGAVENYAWASTFEFTVKRLPLTSSSPATAGSPASGQTYQIVGANASTIVLLEDIVSQFPTDANLWGLWLTYAPDPSLRATGLQAFGTNTAFAIGQANLSTVTRPPTSFGATEALLDASSGKGPAALNGTSTNANATFVRLLWEASITNSGGFYLYYLDGANGLPDYLFDKHGNAVLTGVLVYGAAGDVTSGAPLAVYDCMNAVVVADPFDPAVSALVAQAVPATTAVPATLTLAEAAAEYYADLADTAHVNVSAGLTANVQIAVNEGTYMIPAPQLVGGPGASLPAIATWFGTTAPAIQTANPGITSWPASLAPYTALRLPPLTVAANSTAGDGKTVLSTLGIIAGYFGADVVGLAVDNQDVANLFGAAFSVNAGPWSTSSTLPPGSQLLQLQRAAPNGGSDPASLMLAQFSMLGYQIVANQDFQGSNQGIPVGPTSTGGGTGVGKLRRVNRLSANATSGWQYDVTLAYASRVVGASSTSSPYLGVGRLLQVDLGWYDYFGNTIASDLSTPEPGDSGPPNQTPTLLGYTDALVGLSQWPSVNASWQVGGTYPSPQVVLAFTFDATRYTGKQATSNAATDGQVYAQLAAQLADPNPTAFLVTTSLSSSPVAVTGANLTTLTTWIASIVQYLSQVATGQTPAPPSGAQSLSFPLALTNLPSQQIFELTCGFTFARTGGVVEGEFAAIPGIRSVTTMLQPTTPATKSATPGLVTFATNFEAAYAGPTSALKIATGPDRFEAGAASSSTLWAVQVGKTPAPLSFTVLDANEPLIFAPKPISRQLVTKPAPIWSYTSGTAINFTTPPSFTQTFTNIDLDQWVQALFAAVDALLGAQYIAALTILDNKTPGTLASLQGYKKNLASMYAQQMAIVFTDQSGPNTSVAAMFEQAMFEALGNAYLTQAALQYTASINAGPIDTIPPNLYGPVVQTGTAMSGVAFTPAKFPLPPSTAGTEEPLCVLVTTPTQTGDTTDQYVPVNLSYTASNIEHQIAPPDGSGYQASSWLQFVLSQDAFVAPLGDTKIPMVLRAYPNSPIMASQTGPSTVQDPTTVSEATEWTYAFTYTLPMHYPQDVVSLAVEFNIGTNSGMMLASFADSFAALAEFVAVYPAIAVDLDTSLATLSTTAPAAQFATALAAVQSVTGILDRIAPTAQNKETRRFTFTPPRRSLTSSTGNTYSCTLQETTAAAATPPVTTIDPGALVITVLVPASGGEVPMIELSQQYFDPANPGDAQYITKLAAAPSFDPTTQITTQQYYFIDTTTTKPVPFVTAQGFGPRTVLYPGLQILDLQDAQASASLTRNQNLVHGRTTNDAFVYQTPEVTFTAPCRPTIVQTSPISIGAIAPPPDSHVALAPRSLSDNLTALFYTLIEGASATSASMQLTVSYQYPVAGLPVTLPILMQPALVVSWATGNDTVSTMVTDLTGAITSWFASVLPVGGGNLLFSLTVLTTLSQQAVPFVPLVRLTTLELALSDIANPALPVATVGASPP
jgi:LysM repeat protein